MHMSSKTALRVGLFLRVSRLAAGYGQEQLAALVKVSQPTVSRWERGRSFPGTLQLENLAQLYQIGEPELGSLAEYATDISSQRAAAIGRLLEQSTTSLLIQHPRYYETAIPYYANIAAGLGEFQEQLDGPRSQLEIPREIYERDPASYALRVIGNSMEPLIREGDLLVVSPSAPLTDGCIVAACVEPDGDVVKAYHPNPDGSVVLKPLNPAFPEIKLLPGNGKQARIWGRVVLQLRDL